jgi:hypothetical protein
MSKWFIANKLALHLDKTNILNLITKNSPQHALCAGYNAKYTEETVNMKFLGLQVDNYLNWTNHIDKLTPNLSGAHYAVTARFHVSNTDTLKSVHFDYFHSIMKYGIIRGGNSPNSKKDIHFAKEDC